MGPRRCVVSLRLNDFHDARSRLMINAPGLSGRFPSDLVLNPFTHSRFLYPLP